MIRQRLAGKNRDEGAALLEFVVIVPIFLFALLFVVGLGRWSYAGQRVEAAASAAARAASLSSSSAQVDNRAAAAADASLESAGIACRDRTVDVTADYRPGGSVTVTVVCRVDMSDVVMAGLPGSSPMAASVTVPLETYRDYGDLRPVSP